jgi:thiol-disulfide isomerase/thioredoxin
MNQIMGKALACLAFWLGVSAVCAAQNIRAFEPSSLVRIKAERKGKPFVVMVWSLDCDYCEASFDSLARAKRKNGLDVVTIATDRAEDAQAASLVRKKLKASGLDSDTWAFGSAPAEQLRYAIDPKWRGEMPRSYWFNAHGEASAFSGMITADTVARFLPK